MDCLDQLERHGVFCDVFFTVGVPFETAEDVQQTLQLQKKIRDRYSNVRGIRTFTIEMEPGSPWHLDPEAFGVETCLQNFMDYYHYHSEKKMRFPLWDIGFQIIFLKPRTKWILKRGFRRSGVAISASSIRMPEDHRPLSGEKTLRSVDSGVEGEGFNGKEGFFVTSSLNFSFLKKQLLEWPIRIGRRLFPFRFLADDPFEGANHFWIKLLPSLGHNLFHCLPGLHALTVRPVGHHRIKSVGYRNDTSTQRIFFTSLSLASMVSMKYLWWAITIAPPLSTPAHRGKNVGSFHV